MSDAPQKVVPLEPMSREVMTPMAMIDRAIQAGAGIETLERLMALQERFEANEARREYNEAIAAAKAEIKPIIKKKTASFEGRGNSTVSYAYEDLADVAEIVDPILTNHGLSYKYKSHVDGTIVTMTCIPFHKRGHEGDGATLSAGLDTSGAKNPIQSMGSTVSYLQRYTLKLAFGLAAAKDTDGNGGNPDLAQTITADQFTELRDLLEESGSTEAAMLAYVKANRIEDMTIAQYAKAKAAMAVKISQQKQRKAEGKKQ